VTQPIQVASFDGAPINVFLDIASDHRATFRGSSVGADDVALASVTDISSVIDASTYAFSADSVGPICDEFCTKHIGGLQFVAYRNSAGDYAVIRLDEIYSDGFGGMRGGISYWTARAGSPHFVDALCQIGVSPGPFTTGDVVQLANVRYANFTAGPFPVELKNWIRVPGVVNPVSINRLGADGSLVFPTGLDATLPSIPFFTVTAATPRGKYAIGCALVDPTTGRSVFSTAMGFQIQ